MAVLLVNRLVLSLHRAGHSESGDTEEDSPPPTLVFGDEGHVDSILGNIGSPLRVGEEGFYEDEDEISSEQIAGKLEDAASSSAQTVDGVVEQQIVEKTECEINQV